MKEAELLELIEELKGEIQQSNIITELRDTELYDLTSNLIDSKIADFRRQGTENNKGFTTLNFREKQQITNAIYESIRGLGVLGQIIADSDITEVMINGYRDIFIEKEGRLYKTPLQFSSRRELEIIITKFVSSAGRQVNESDPIVDTRLDDGSRVCVVMPPIALDGPIVTIRRFPKETMTIEKLIAFGSLSEDVADVLRILVRSKYNIFICGGTGSGKTTFLNALSNFIPADERVITIEDSAELQIKGIENLVRLETRNAGVDGTGAITIRDLIRSALRMRPERIVVGEVRGAEALDMLQAMNTGHDGSLSTGHANSTRDMLLRLETMSLQGTEGLPLDAVRQQIASAIDVIIHLARLRDKSRKTMEIVEVLGYDQESRQIQLNTLYEFREDAAASNSGRVVGRLYRTDNKLVNVYKLHAAGITDII